MHFGFQGEGKARHLQSVPGRTVKRNDKLPVWGRGPYGTKPFLALEITRSRPFDRRGWRVFHASRTEGGLDPRRSAEFRGEELVERCLALVKRLLPVRIALFGGEPLVRRNEIARLVPEFDRLGIEVQLITSGLLPIPPEYRMWDNLQIVIALEEPRAECCGGSSATRYRRILDNILGQTITVHCTITKQSINAPARLRNVAEFWSARDEVRAILFSLYTPNDLLNSEKRLLPTDRQAIVKELNLIRHNFSKVYLPDSVLARFLHPPQCPSECGLAQTTSCVAADLVSNLIPCPLSGNPVCSECGLIASAGLSRFWQV